MAHAQGRTRRLFATLAIVALVVSGAVVGQASTPAWAASYPSWSDVQSAQRSESAKKAEIARLKALLAQLEANVVAAQEESQRKGQEYYEAQLAYDAAAYKAEQLQAQADEAQATADESILQAGQIAAKVQRAGSQDISMRLFFGSDGESDLLSNLGMASKVSQQSSGIYAKAKRDQNTAQALSDESDIAKEALKGLAEVAEKAMVEAQKAADAADAALAEQAGNQERLEAQLASLVQNRIVTEQQYAVGAEIRRKAELERQRLAEIERQKQAAAGGANSNGWARPSSGYASSSYGPRVPPTAGASSWHMGTDFGASCYSNIRAASSGRVIYAGWNGGYGNFVKIDHGGGLTTAYAHIANGGIKVGYGQNVSAGQVIAVVGTTGVSTGCHLHFEVRRYGTATDPVAFLRSKGVSL
jgi:murein DD-endopeptidase MepM/ murein hydrolase activator NlpD